MITPLLLLSLLIHHGVPEDDAKVLTCIAKYESQYNPAAVNHAHNRNKTKDWGLFQINDINLSKCNVTTTELLDVKKNIKCAVKVYQTQGLQAWSTYKFCAPELASR